MIRLEILNGPHAGTCQRFSHGPLLLGREEHCDWVMDHDSLISRTHAELSWEDGGPVTVRDLEAKHGTWINGSRIEGAHKWLPGEMLTIGDTRLIYAPIPQAASTVRRRPSLLEGMTGIFVGVFLLLQLVFLIAVAPLWRSYVQQEALREEPPEPVEAEVPLVPPEVPDPEPVPPGPTPEPAPTPVPAPTPTPVPSAVGLSPEAQLALVRELVNSRRWLEADRVLTQMLDEDPERVEARAEQARLFGRRSMFRDSQAAWEQVLALADPDSELAREATIEIPLMDRRARLLEDADRPTLPIPTPLPRPTPLPPQQVPTPLPTPVPTRPQEATPRRPQVLIQNLHMSSRFDASSLFQELRLFTAEIRHVSDSPPIAAGEMVMEAHFFEEVGGQIRPAEIPEPVVRLRVQQPLQQGAVLRNLEWAYEVPLNRPPRADRRFAGVILRVRVRDQLVAESAVPANLLRQ